MKKLIQPTLFFLSICILSVISFSQTDESQTNQPQLVIQTGHSSQINNLWLSPDNKNLVSQSQDRVIFWDLQTREILREVREAGVFYTTGNARTIIIKDNQGALSFWETSTGKFLFSLARPNDWSLSKDGTKIVIGNEQGIIKVIELATGKVVFEKQTEQKKIIKNCRFGADDKVVIASAEDTNLTGGIINIFWIDENRSFTLVRVGRWAVGANSEFLLIGRGGDKRPNPNSVKKELPIVENDENHKLLEVSDLTVYNLNQPEQILTGKGKFDPFDKWEISPTGKYIFGYGKNGTNVWEAKTLNLKFNTANYSPSGFSEDDKLLFLINSSQKQVYDLEKSEMLPPIPNDTNLYRVSPNRETLLLKNNLGEFILWNLKEGRIIFTRKEEFAEEVSTFIFSPDGKKLAFVSADDNFYSNAKYKLSVFDCQTGGETVLSENRYASLDPLRKRLYDSDDEPSINPPYVKLLFVGKSEYPQFGNLEFTSDSGKIVFGDSSGNIVFGDTNKGSYLNVIKGHSSAISADFVVSGKGIIVRNDENILKTLDVETGQILSVKSIAPPQIKVVPSSREELSNGTYRLKAKTSAKILFEVKDVSGCEFFESENIIFCKRKSSDGNYLNSDIEVWDLKGKKKICFLQNVEHWKAVGELIAISRRVETAGAKYDSQKNLLLEVWNAKKNLLVYSSVFPSSFHSFRFSPDGKKFIVFGYSSSSGIQTHILDVTTWAKIYSNDGFSNWWQGTDWKFLFIRTNYGIEWHDFGTKSVQTIYASNQELFKKMQEISGFAEHSVNKKFVLFQSSQSQKLLLWNVAKEEIYRLDKHTAKITSSKFSADEKFLMTSSEDGSVNFWNTDNGKLLLTYVLLDENDWVAVDSEGRFDASANAARLMSWRVGNDVISFEQLKARFYEPNLWQKTLGFSKEALRDVSGFKNILLPPDVEEISAENQANSTLRTVKIKNKGGGIGRVQVFVNGREFLEDARDEKLKSNPNVAEYVLSFDLKGAPFIAGETPDVKVVAWNFDANAKERFQGYASSRGTAVFYIPDKSQIVEPPTLYAIIGGVSDYAGDQIDLKFAAKDAEDIYKAIQIGGKNLFGVAKMNVKLLATGNPNALAPTKENLRKVFAEFAEKAKPQDILFVYLSGHGITLNGSDTYYYLTQDAPTADRDKLSKDSVLLANSTVSSEELTVWHKKVQALKQVLILDTCAAGALGKEFKIVEKKELSTDAKRAIENMQDRVGFHILMGSAADAVSYEASQYGQGLLTYSLLQGMRGAALKDNGEIDISKLFNFAADTVPNLAKNIGGIQKPEIRIPEGGASFSIGIVKTEADKKLIPLQQNKPLILRPRLQNAVSLFDDEELGILLEQALREAAYVSAKSENGSRIVFVETNDMPDAILPSGSYKIVGNQIFVTVVLIRNKKPIGLPIKLTSKRDDKENLIKQLAEAIVLAAEKFR